MVHNEGREEERLFAHIKHEGSILVAQGGGMKGNKLIAQGGAWKR